MRDEAGRRQGHFPFGGKGSSSECRLTDGVRHFGRRWRR
ncbi:hypothetical protein ACVW19_006923 [Streptomyces sp. TE5632]